MSHTAAVCILKIHETPPVMRVFLLAALCLLLTPASGQNTTADAVQALKFRAIGPALMGGRIADIAVSPSDARTWYIGVGSGGVWKTTNAGVTFAPIFDSQSSYSIGDVELDPSNPEVVWVGTGENVSGRHVAWGDGIYRSRDGGQTWKNMGLPHSEHIGKILVDPRDGDVVFVAAEGPLWSSGGDRGLYKTTDQGATWWPVLQVDENTGVTDVEFHPTNPDIMYAATYQRRRHVWSLLAGGPESGIYKSTDAGNTWRRVSKGLPKGDVGKIGLAVTAADPDRVFATMEAKPAERGFYRSENQGESWSRHSSYISGGTGPHYYQEIEASQTDPNLVYQMDVWLHVTRNGGDDFTELETGFSKHADNHAMWIDPNDGEHILVGSDAGLYESFDEGLTFRHFPNLPVSQFYKVAMNNAEPFYDVVAGAQDLGTLMGPSRTMNGEGVRNRDWYVPLGSDGQGVAFDPNDDDTGYMATQGGNWYRHNRVSEETVDITPQPAPGDQPERWNWDAPIHINANRVYVASQRLWMSEDQGDSWTALSGDLTRNVNRYELELMGRVWSVDALYHNGAMSKYSTITGISESTVSEGTIYVGSDDGVIHATDDGGGEWRRAAALPGVPELAFINDVEASQHEAGSVFAVADAHKTGDYSPYVFESRDGGRSWTSIRGDLPDGTIVWMIQQDHVDPDLLFLATEFGIYASLNHGANWNRVGGTPTISFRDIQIHRRDEDLVAASFGRGIYVLDDYTPLRLLDDVVHGATAGLLPIRDAWWYVPNNPMQAPGKPTLGSDDFTADNPPFGAVMTYFLAEAPSTLAEERGRTEKGLREDGADIPFPGWDRLRAESVEGSPQVLIAISDDAGQPVSWVEGPKTTGLHRVAWDLRLPAPDPVDLTVPGFVSPWSGSPLGALAGPGAYTAQMYLVSAAGVAPVGEPMEFSVIPVPTTPQDTDFDAVAAFQQEASELMRRVQGASQELGRMRDQLRHMRAALLRTPGADPELFGRLDLAGADLQALSTALSGDRVRGRLNETALPAISNRVRRVARNVFNTREPATATQRASLGVAASQFESFLSDYGAVLTTVSALEHEMEAAGAPWTPGRPVRD